MCKDKDTSIGVSVDVDMDMGMDAGTSAGIDMGTCECHQLLVLPSQKPQKRLVAVVVMKHEDALPPISNQNSRT